MLKRMKDYACKALNIGRGRSRRSYTGLQGSHAYTGLYSPYHPRNSQPGMPATNTEFYWSDKSAGYRPAEFEQAQPPSYVPDEYDALAPPKQQRPMRSPTKHIREHEVEMMRERLCELHETLKDMGCTPDTQVEDAPGHLRKELGEVLRERQKIARDLGDLSEDILEIEKAIEEQRRPHDLDEPLLQIGEAEIGQDYSMPARGEEAGQEYGLDALAYDGMHEGVNMSGPSTFSASQGEETRAEQTIGMAARQHVECDEDNIPDGGWQRGMYEHNGMLDDSVFPEAIQSSDQQQQQQELERQEPPQPGPFDIPGGLEGLL